MTYKMISRRVIARTLNKILAINIGQGHFAFLLILALSLLSFPTRMRAVSGHTMVVTKSEDTDDGICDSDCSLREAIASAGDGDVIEFNESHLDESGTAVLSHGELVVSKIITIRGTRLVRIEARQSGLLVPASRVINNTGQLTLVNMTITGGTAPMDFGGGIFNSGTLTLINTTVTGNSAGTGGGIENRGTLDAINSTISSNTAFHPTFRGEAGGIDNAGTLTLTNCTISNNNAIDPANFGALGGGIFQRSAGSTTLKNVTLANNSAKTDGGGIFSSGSVTVGNTIVANNVSDSNSDDIFGSVTSLGFNLIQRIVGTVGGATTGNVIGVDPLFDPLGLRDNGGATKTIALQQNSPAVDKGNGVIAGVSTDQRGQPRPFDNPAVSNAPGGDGSDIGAFEVQGGPVISIGNASLAEGDSGTATFNFTVSLSVAASQTVTVDYATANISAGAPGDYISTSGQLSFVSGETSKQITVLVNGDQLIEGDETFAINLTNPTGSTVSVTNGQGTGTILNDDNAGSFQFSSSGFSVNENVGTATITVTRTGGSGSGASITYATQNGTATVGQDYTATSGSLLFAANENSKTFGIPITNDTVIEPNETVNIQLFSPTLGGIIGNPGAAILTIIDDDTPVIRTRFDFDGDGKADVSVFRPSGGDWYRLSSSNGAFSALHFGQSGDLIVPADFDGDGKSDLAVFRPSIGDWYRINSSDGTFSATQFGQNGDLPVPADYDGDGSANIAVFRPSNGTWYTSTNPATNYGAVQFGTSTDLPAVGDYDGDGKADISLFRPSTGSWYRLNSGNGAFVGVGFGASEDKPVPADFDGDGKSDIAVFRPSVGDWYRLNSGNGTFVGTHFGAAGDRPSPADFDGDGKSDIVVFRPSSGNWYFLNSTTGFAGVNFGVNGDSPIPNAFVY